MSLAKDIGEIERFVVLRIGEEVAVKKKTKVIAIFRLIIAIQIKDVLSNPIQPHSHGYNITRRLVKAASIVPNSSNAENNDSPKGITNKNKNENEKGIEDNEVNLTNNYQDTIINEALEAVIKYDNSTLGTISKGNEYVYSEMADTDAIAYRMKDEILSLLSFFMKLIRDKASKKSLNEIESANQDQVNANPRTKSTNKMAVNNTKYIVKNETITNKNNESKILDTTEKFPIVPKGMSNNSADVNNITASADKNKTLEQDKQNVIKDSTSEAVNVNLSANDTDKPIVDQNNFTDIHTHASDNIIGNVINSTPNCIKKGKNVISSKRNGVQKKINTIAAIVKKVVEQKINDYFKIQSIETKQGDNDADIEIDSSSSTNLPSQKSEVTLREFSLTYAL